MKEMTWAHIIRDSERKLFKRCRRAWDFGSRTRQNCEPIKPARVFNFERAIQEALAVYYFPGMWEWNREIVRPLALEAFFKSMRDQRAVYAQAQELSVEQEQNWQERFELGAGLLNRYFEWSPAVDSFSPIRVQTPFEVNIPDPAQPGQDLMVREGVPIRYRGRINLLVVNGRDSYWLVEHRVFEETWDNIDRLALDEQGTYYCWAWENFFLGMRIAGVIYNELRVDTAPKFCASSNSFVSMRQNQDSEIELVAGHRRVYAQSATEPDQVIKQLGNEFFRRTQVPVSRARLKNFGKQLALEAIEMTDPKIRLYPNPSVENCSNCVYRKPCIATNEGSGASLILETQYRNSNEEDMEPGRLGGSTWPVDRGAMPPKRD